MNSAPASSHPPALPELNIIRAAPNIPDHELLRCIGRGSYGEVWLGRSIVGAWRAIKVVYKSSFEDVRPFEREFTGIQKFEPISRSDEGLVDILQIGRDNAQEYFYYIMELADDALQNPASANCNGKGGQLEPCSYRPKTLAFEKKMRGRLPAAECLNLGIVLSTALEHLHREGLVHRDIKPSNIIFVGGIPKLADIGLVAELSEARSYVGTEGYIPPEGPNSAQADVYSLGKVLYEITTGKDRQDFPEPMTSLEKAPDGELLAELNAIVLKACDPDLSRRYKTAHQMHKELSLIERGKSVRQHRARKRRARLLVCATVVAGAISLAGLSVETLLDWRIGQIQGTSSRIAPRLIGKIPERAPSTPPRLIDLSPHYNASLIEAWHPGPVENTLMSLPRGLVQLAGTDFDARGLVQLSGREIMINGADNYPLQIAGIGVAQWVKRLHFLHGTISEMEHGGVIGHYEIRYSGKSRAEIPIRYGVNVHPLWQPRDSAGMVNDAVLAWQGENAATKERNLQLRVYRFTWENPHPDKEVQSINFISAMRNSAPFLIALTADEAEPLAGQANQHPDLINLLQKHALEFQEFPESNHLRPVVLSNTPVVVDGIHYHALRLRVPAGATQDMIWALSAPRTFRAREWYIAPVSGRMKSAFEDWYHAEDDSAVKEREFTFQYLNGKKLRPGAEYLLWFSLDSATSPQIELLLKFIPAGSADPNHSNQLLRALGFDHKTQGARYHRHYCLGAMK